MARGVFSLNRVYKKQFQNVNDGNFESWPESATYGYFGGGRSQAAAELSNISRLDYQVEVFSNPGNSNFTLASRGRGSVQTNLYGFYAGGFDFPSTTYSQVERLDFSTEVVSDPGTKLPEIKQSMGSFENHSYGYFTGGRRLPDANYRSSIDRLDFTTETCAPTPIGSLPNTNASNSGLQTNDYGYFAGGSFFPPLTRYDDIFRFQFSNETVSTLTAVLNNNIQGTYTTQCPQYGYIAGGNSFFTPDVYRSNIERLDFSNETVQLMPNKIFGEFGFGGFSSSSTYGYMFCGINDTGTTSTSSMSRINFSNETVATVSPFPFDGWSFRRGLSGGQSQRPKGSRTYGYFGAGQTSVYDCIINRLDFSNETVSLPGNDLPQGRRTLKAVSSSSYGYFGGGNEEPFVSSKFKSTVDRLDFSNETASAPGNNFLFERNEATALSSSSYGYFAGGQAQSIPYTCTIDRLDFSNETTSTPGNDLLKARRQLGAVSSSSYGYFGGGSSPNSSPPPSILALCTIDRLDFSNETVSLPGNDLPQINYNFAAVSNSNYGYLGGGFDPGGRTCTINRLDFSNETVSVPGNGITEARSNLAAVSSSSYGYFAGGSTSGNVCTIDRLDFSNETTSAPGNGIPQATWGLAGVSN